jgi:flavin-dependent dehydrogenase
MNTDIKYYDILIIGGGPSGSVTSLLLSKHGFKVAMIDSNTKKKFGTGECLAPESKPLLEQLGLWKKLKNDGHVPCYGNQSVWQDNSIRSNDFMYSPWGHGWQLDRLKFDLMLQKEARRNNVDVVLGSKITSIQWTNSQWVINGTREQFITRFLVDAAGRNSCISYRLGSRRHFLDHQVAISGRFQTRINYDTDSFTLVEAAENGWWYCASLPCGYKIVTFFTNPQNASINRNKSFFINQISKTMYISRLVFPNYSLKDNPIVVPANTSILDKIIGNNWLAVGDAAISHDPISSYGLTFALRTGFHAAYSIKSTFNNDSSTINKYEQSLKQEFKRFLLKLKHTYSNSKFFNSYWTRFDLMRYN